MIPLARAAAAAGDEVLFAVPAEAVPRIEAFGFAAAAVPFGDPADIGRAWAILPDHDLNSYVVADIFLRIYGPGSAARAPRPDREFQGGPARRRWALWGGYRPAASAAACWGSPPWTWLIWTWDRVAAALDDLRESAGLTRSGRMPYDSGSRYLSAVPPLLWADPAHQPSKAIWFRHEDAEGPVRVLHLARPRPRPQVYATLGSVAGQNDFGRPIFRLVLAALGRLDADALFTVGPFDRAQLGSVPANVTIAAYAPQAEAMECDVVVTHAGSGTTVAALTRGLPLVAVPMFADQMHNADRLVAAGVGIRVDPGRDRRAADHRRRDRPRRSGLRGECPPRTCGPGDRCPTNTGPGHRPAALGCECVAERALRRSMSGRCSRPAHARRPGRTMSPGARGGLKSLVRDPEERTR